MFLAAGMNEDRLVGRQVCGSTRDTLDLGHCALCFDDRVVVLAMPEAARSRQLDGM